ncbi:MAG TPA: hypothetical protein DIW31_08405 [Bacteroidales bacterium]|nr:hypothetical protein [Bacteroidales bacterium]
MKIKTAIIILFFMAIMIGCTPKSQLLNIPDITLNKEFIIKHTDTTKNIFSIHLVFKGEIDGNALIILKDGVNYSKEYKLERGKVDFNIDTDWYNTKCIIGYAPQDVTSGKLVVEYKFYEQ